MSTRAESVRSFFGVPDRYLCGRQYNIRLRTETVQEFLRGSRPESILDIGCGDGSLSIPLLRSQNRLTLLDLSSAMLSIAHARVPARLRSNVDVVNADFLAAGLDRGSFDLILCVGVLAHVDDPLAAIAEISSLATPGATVIIEVNDYHHFLSRIWRPYSSFRSLFTPGQYALNELSWRLVRNEFASRGFDLAGRYCYSVPLPGMSRMLGQNGLYRGIRTIYGTSDNNRNEWLANEFILHFKRCHPNCEVQPAVEVRH